MDRRCGGDRKKTIMNQTRIVVSALACISPLLGLAGQFKEKVSRRNIVVIIADDLARNELGCYGGKNVRTPNIDRLAQEGVRFDRMFSSTTMSFPTRASLYTGLYPVRNGVYKNHQSTRPNVKSVVHYLGALGYRVGLTGKTHVRPESVYPFESVEGFEPNCVSRKADYHTAGIVEFMTREASQPFCLFVGSTHPHAPWTVGDPSKFNPAGVVLPPHFVDNRETRIAFTRYLAEIEELDRQVGDILQAIREADKEKETMVIFSGEQGPQFPGGKWTSWDYGQKSGFIIRTPENYLAGTVSNALLQYEDLLPTLIGYAGGKVPGALEGKSFLPLLEGKKSTHRKWVYGIHNNFPEGRPYPIRSIRNDQYKLIVNFLHETNYHEKHLMGTGKENYWNTWVRDAGSNPVAQKWVGRFLTRPRYELYDTEKDPWELNNLAADPALLPVIRKLEKELRAWMKWQGDPGEALDVVTAE